jgi:PEP-CTERM motif-containing protein
MNSNVVRSVYFVAALVMAAATARADLRTFELTYSGAPLGNTAIASATITLDTARINNPGFTEQDLSPFVTAFSITVSGARAGNGTFGLNDFVGGSQNYGGFFFDTDGGTLDFSRDLFGQPTAEAPYGSTPGASGSGDFNIDSFGVNPVAPVATYFFQILTDGGSGNADKLNLTSFHAIPEPGTLAMLGVGSVFVVARRRRSTPNTPTWESGWIQISTTSPPPTRRRATS